MFFFRDPAPTAIKKLSTIGDVDYPEWGTLFTGALVALAIAICCHALFYRPLEKMPLEKKASQIILQSTSTPKKLLTLRIDEVPIHKSREAFECDLRSIIDRDPGLKEDSNTIMQHLLVRRDQKIACATATFHTSIPANEVIRKLREAGIGLPYCFDSNFHGITPLYDAQEGADVDVIAVPSLRSHAIDVPNIRVLLYGYDTSLLGNDSIDSIEDLGRRFLESIKAFRANITNRRPIIFIGHSLGGLLIKEALVYAWKKFDDP
ncbi:hypothetical protein GQ44DRAFT_777431 [Phaeosphaeriaceae sp. PMI808]|nr:hypothetical protein GQ44DRAFT_777431 [Phaeosphaeriaceae sp. PMI808]